MEVVKEFRGISKRLAIHYLEGLGGQPVDEAGAPVDGAGETAEAAAGVDRVQGDGWTVNLSTTRVSIGPSIEVTEVRTAFEGEAETVERLVEEFSFKAMRAGG
ncbi:MAG: hypothetical protein V5A23_06580 [Halobacteriales archaeon]